MSNDELLKQLRNNIAAIEGNENAPVKYPKPATRPVSAERSRPDEQASDEDAAVFKKIIDLVNISDRSEAGLRARLARYDYSQESIDRAVIRAKDLNFINDARFADVLIRSRVRQGKGSLAIERELKSNGIDPFEIDGWPYDYIVEEDELERAVEFLLRKPPRSKNVREGAYRKLMQKGFPSSIASKAVRVFLERYED